MRDLRVEYIAKYVNMAAADAANKSGRDKNAGARANTQKVFKTLILTFVDI